MKQLINNILTYLFPFKELHDRPSVFIGQTWLEKNMDPLHVKDYLWTPSKF
jgi:hypothetical protein